MKRKDCLRIAECVNAGHPVPRPDSDGPYDRAWQSGASSAVGVIARALANMLAEDNPNFNRSKFLEACAVSDF